MRRFLAICASGMVFGLAVLVSAARADDGIETFTGAVGGNSGAIGSERSVFTDTGETPSLKDVLNAGLKARLPQEFAFTDRVVRMVNRGQLPLDMVQSTFLWAQHKPIHQYQYFEHGLKLRAEQAGVRM